MQMFQSLVFLCVFGSLCITTGCSDGSVPNTPPSLSSEPSPNRSESEKPFATITPEAASVIQDFISDDPKTKYYVRIRIAAGGCQGYMQKLDMDPVKTSDDVTCESEGLTIIALKRQIEIIRGSKIDYVQNNVDIGFKIDNPNFAGECLKKSLAILHQQPIAE